MAEEIQYEQLDETSSTATPAADVDLTRISEIPMELSVEIGRTEMTVGETLALGVGMIVALDRLAGEPVDLLANGTPIARGEVIVIDDRLGMRVTEIIEAAGKRNGAPAEPLAASDEMVEEAPLAAPEPLAPPSPTAEGPAGEAVAA
jgi:flagellar motor switch protein FliN/FliY